MCDHHKMARLYAVLALALVFTSACEPRVRDYDSMGEDEGDDECEDELPAKDLAPRDDNDRCDVRGEYRACQVGTPSPGLQFCDGEWGPCLTDYACIPGDYFACYLCDPEFGTWWSECMLRDGVPFYDADACTTPLVLRFGDDPVEFTTTPGRFAMTADDRCPATDWPTAATPWLALDRDRSGSIDGGHELFGSGTRLGPTYATDGFAALAALDVDGDARITPADVRWSELLLWFDHDGDRRSTPWELEPLAAHGVAAIDLRHDVGSPRCDARGNCELERAPVIRGSGTAIEVIDVHLSCQ